MSAGNCLYRRTEDFRQLVTIRGANLDGSSSELRRRAIVACAQHGTATTSAQHLGKEPAQLRIMYIMSNYVQPVFASISSAAALVSSPN